jgi:hypothetical protein
MSTYELKFEHPSLAVSTVLEPRDIKFGGDLNQPLSFTAIINSDFGDYSDDTSATNPIQLKSPVTFTRNGRTEFIGEVVRTTITYDGASVNERSIKVECIDRLGMVKAALASISGDALALVNSTTATVTERGFLPTFSGSPSYLPDPAVGGYYPTSGSPRTVFHSQGSIGIGGTILTTTSTVSNRMRNWGFLEVSTGGTKEWMSYTSHINNGGTWEFRGVAKGRFGSSDLAHTNQVVNQLVPHRIDPNQTVLVEGNNGSSWVTIPNTDYSVEYDDGALLFTSDPAPTYTGGIRASYTEYTEENASATVLGNDATNGLIDLLLQETQANGGPEIGSGDLDIDLPVIVVPLTQLFGAGCLDTIAQLLGEQYGNDYIYDASMTERFTWAYWYDSVNTNFVIDRLDPSAAVTDVISEVSKVVTGNTLTNISSHVLVKWTFDLDQQSQLVPVLATASSFSGNVFNSTVHAKLRTNGMPRVAITDVGESGQPGALTQAAADLQKGWLLAYSHEYTLKEVPTNLPARGKRYTMPDGITGTCIGVNYEMRDGMEAMRMQIVDLDQEIA